MNVTLTAGTAGQRADQFLAAALDGLTRSAAQKLLEEGRVLRGGKALKKNDRLQPGDVLTRLILRQRRLALRVAVDVREIERSHARVVVVAETMPDAVLFVHTHMAHLHRQEIFEHRLPDPALVYVLGDAEYARLGAAVDYFVQSLVSDVRKVEFKICIAQEVAPLVGVGFIYLHRAVCGDLIYRGFILTDSIIRAVVTKVGAAVKLDYRDLWLRRVVADLRGLHNRLVYPVVDNIRCDRQVDRA